MDGTYSGWYFTDSIQNVIHSLKYDERAKLGKELGFQLGILFTLEEIEPVDALVPVPLHSVKKRERGFNQTEWIVKGIASKWDIPVDCSILKRNKYTETQTKLSSEERKQNMEMAFEVTKQLNGKKNCIG